MITYFLRTKYKVLKTINEYAKSMLINCIKKKKKIKIFIIILDKNKNQIVNI